MAKSGRIKCPACGKWTDIGLGNDNGPCHHCGVWISKRRKKSKLLVYRKK